MSCSNRSRPTLRTAALAALCGALLVCATDARAYTRTFAAGSLIIPAQMEYQTDCGMVSAYGLVYWLLYKNAELTAAGKKPLTIYWIIEPKKLSHHRCNASTDTLPDYSKPNDNDGCDLVVQNAAGQPVARLLSNNTEQAPFNVFTTTYNGSTGESARTSGTPGTALGSTRKVTKYSGGAWVIDAADRQTVLDLFAGDAEVGRFRNGAACTGIGIASPTHHVEVHTARIGFNAQVARMINVKPGRIALLDAGAVTILQQYLKNAGLGDFPNAGGTPEDHGLIYDTLTPVLDFISTPAFPRGALNAPDPDEATKPMYEVMWAPHWESDSQTTRPGEGYPGDSKTGDGKWTSFDPVTNTHDDSVTNALKNIAHFADQGNGVFAECASIASLEGSYDVGTVGCSGNYECECTDAMQCSFGAKEPFGCGIGYTNTCGGCYQCPAGYTLDADDCSELRCVSDANQCTPGFTWVDCGTTSGCYNCASPPLPTGYALDTSQCPGSPARCRRGGQRRAANAGPVDTAPAVSQALTCNPGFEKVCIPSASSIELNGADATRIHMTNRLQKNGIGGLSNPWGVLGYSAPDCTDKLVPSATPAPKYRSTSTGDCLDMHADTGGPGNIFAQKGNFNFKGAGSSHVHHYMPPANVGSFYNPGVLKFATSDHPSTASRRGWDFMTIRHKDNDPSKGMVIYLAGHSYSNDVGGNRLVLNTLLNLGFSDAGVEFARSEPAGYITRDIDPSTGQWVVDSTTKQPRVLAQTAFQGTYVQRPPPGVFQDWLNYNAALPQAWRFPYIDGHLRAYDLEKISTTKQDFRSNALWDTAANVPAPAERRLFTALKGTVNTGWSKLDLRYPETQPGTCVSSGQTDKSGNTICALSWELAACGTAGVTQAALADPGDGSGALRKKLGMFVQQVRGHCSAHSKVTGDPFYEPTDGQCDDLKQQKNRAKLGGIDHSSPSVVGPSRYIGNDAKTGIKWALRPVVAYVGGRDGMLHSVYVSGADASWSAEGASLPAGIQPGTELWAYLPPGQLCGLATNSAMVDAVVNVVDVFGNFPRDANNDGVFDLSSADERPNGIRRWRTILIAAAGQGGSEVFALDVTNPLKPILLWDIAGAKDTNDTFDATDPRTYAWKYSNPAGGVSAKNADEQPRVKTALNDYRNLGLTFGSSVGMLWRGNAYRYVVYLTTSAADFGPGVPTPLGFKGVEVFAVDVITGEKVWHWQNRYARARDSAGLDVIADNTIPGRPALVDVDQNGTVDRVYVGDMEGHLWELDGETGRNVNFLHDKGSGKFHALPFFGTPPMTGGSADASTKDLFKPYGSASLAQQPLTSPIGLGRMTSVPCSVYKYLEGRIDVAQGSMGVDWAIAPFESGNLFVLPSSPEVTAVRLKDAGCTKLTGNVLTVDTRRREIDLSAVPAIKTRGVLLPEAVWEIPLGVGERMFGMPKLVGNDVLVNTSAGSFSGDITDTAGDEGTTKIINEANPTGKVVVSIGKAFGGVLVIDEQVIVTSATGMVRVPDAVTGAPKGAEATKTTARNRFSPTTFGSWEERPSEPR
jgi:hypothetical protein